MTGSPLNHQYETYVRENETWNFAVNLVDLTLNNLAMSFIYGSTILSLYVSNLTSSVTLIGLIPAIQRVGHFLPQLLMSRRAEQVPRKKPLVLKLGVMERLPYLFIALSILLWPEAPHWLAFTILAASLATATIGGGLGGPPWQSMLAKVIRVQRRGRFFGLSRALGGLLGVVGAGVSRRVFAAYPYPISFGICFLLCSVFWASSLIPLSLTRELPKEPSTVALSGKDYWRRLPKVLQASPNFARYLASRALVILGTMGTPFYVLYAREAFGTTNAFAADLTMVTLIAQTTSTPLLGWLGDRRGHKWLTELSTLIGACAAAIALLKPEVAWFYGVFALMSTATAGMGVAATSITMEFSDPEEIPTFAALANTLLAIPVLSAPLVGGWLADVAGYKSLFVVALTFSSLGWFAMHWGVREPRYQRQVVSPS